MTGDPSRRLGLALTALTTLLWGVLAIGLKVAVDRVDLLSIVWFRFTFAFFALLLWLGIKKPADVRVLRRPPLLGALAGLFLGANYAAYMLGLDLTTPSNAQVLIQLAPLFYAGLGILLFGERLRTRQLLLVIVPVIGFLLFYRDQLANLVGDDGEYARGNLWILVAAAVWAIYAVFQKREIGNGTSPQSLNLVLYAVPAVVLLPFARPTELVGLGFGDWMLMVYLGANTVIAYGTLAEGMKRLPAHEISLVICTTPLITLGAMQILRALDVDWIEHDRVALLGWLGAAMVVVGVGLVLHAQSRPVPAGGDDLRLE